MCDPACQKIIADTQMATLAASAMYGEVLSDLGVRGSPRAAVHFYVAVVNVFAKTAQWLNEQKLTEAQRATLTAQIQKMCYRADDLIAWSIAADGTIHANASTWRDEMLGWAKDDQVVFTALIEEVRQL